MTILFIYFSLLLLLLFIYVGFRLTLSEISYFLQGSYPFSPFAMPSPNGIAEASVSF